SRKDSGPHSYCARSASKEGTWPLPLPLPRSLVLFSGMGADGSSTARSFLTRPPTGTPRSAISPGRGPSNPLHLSLREWPGCPLLRASNEHILIVRVLRARRAPGRSLLFPPHPREQLHQEILRPRRKVCLAPQIHDLFIHLGLRRIGMDRPGDRLRPDAGLHRN